MNRSNIGPDSFLVIYFINGGLLMTEWNRISSQINDVFIYFQNKRFFVDLLLLRLDRLRKNDVFDGNIKAVTSSWVRLNRTSIHPIQPTSQWSFFLVSKEITCAGADQRILERGAYPL